MATPIVAQMAEAGRTPSSQRCETGSVNIPVGKWPASSRDTSADANKVADDIIGALSSALQKGDFAAAGDLFLAEDSYWRDHLVLTWDLRTIKGRAGIVAFLSQADTKITGVEVDRSTEYRSPELKALDFDNTVMGIEFFVTLTTSLGGRAQGVVRLVQEEEKDGGKWKIWTFFATLRSIDGYDEPLKHHRAQGVLHGEHMDRRNWQERRTADTEFKDSDPAVLIVGAGQAGLTAHARLKMLGVPTLVIDKNDAVGDSWRKRYHQLVLHDPVWYDHMPYLHFPAHWPIFTPKDKLAEFFESYAKLLELNVWTRTTIKSSSWDGAARRWNVELQVQQVVNNGEGGAGKVETVTRTLHPRHIIQATGHSGKANLPSIKGMDSFQGDVLCHSSEFAGARPQSKGKKAVVVGSCNSSHDICHDFYEKGYDVTMVQRSSTCVVTCESNLEVSLRGLYDEDGPPVEDADLWQFGIPNEVFKARHQQVARAMAEYDADILGALTAAGFRLDCGPDDAGLFFKYLQRGGGYYIDVGASSLIVDDKIKVRQGQEIAEVLPHGLRLADASVLDADEIVFATGYQNMRSEARSVFGDAVADAIGDVWGFDAEGESRTIWRRSGHPGFWMHGGNLALCRYYSRLLALQIKALEEGLTTY